MYLGWHRTNMADGENEEGAGGRYRVESRAWHVAAVDSKVLSLRDNDDGSSTRRIIDPLIVENPRNPKASVKVTLHAQRRSRRGGQDPAGLFGDAAPVRAPDPPV
jgi:hypothetical protein